MLSRETEQKLVELFITISTGEEKISKLKQNILTKYNINPLQLFFKMDIKNTGFLSKNDLASYLKFFSIDFIPRDIHYIFYFYDKDNDNALSFYEFLDLVISDSNYLYKKSYKKKYRHNKFEQNEINGEIDINIEKNILQIFLEEIDLARNLNDLILYLKDCNDFVVQDVFYEIKSYSYITNDSLKAFFDRNEVTYNDKFIKNIFNRFDIKEINGKISYNKFKNFFDLPYIKNQNLNTNMSMNMNMNVKKIKNNNNQYMESPNPQTISQTYVSGDIKYNNNNNMNTINSNSNIYSTINQPKSNYNINNNNFDQNFLNNEKYINEEDIQFECSHMSRSGSVESIDKDKNYNCKFISKKEDRNNLYKNYLREKRSKSLEKSLSRSLSRTSEGISRTEKLNLYDKNENNMINLRPIYDKYNGYNNTSLNETNNNLSNSVSSCHEDIPIKLPVRLDKNLVKRPAPKRNNLNDGNYNNNRMVYNFCYDNHFEDINLNNMNNQMSYGRENEQIYPQNYNNRNNDEYYYSSQSINDKDIKQYDNGNFYQGEKYDDERINLSNLDLKMYQEDIGRQINNGRY